MQTFVQSYEEPEPSAISSEQDAMTGITNTEEASRKAIRNNAHEIYSTNADLCTVVPSPSCTEGEPYNDFSFYDNIEEEGERGCDCPDGNTCSPTSLPATVLPKTTANNYLRKTNKDQAIGFRVLPAASNSTARYRDCESNDTMAFEWLKAFPDFSNIVSPDQRKECMSCFDFYCQQDNNNKDRNNKTINTDHGKRDSSLNDHRDSTSNPQEMSQTSMAILFDTTDDNPRLFDDAALDLDSCTWLLDGTEQFSNSGATLENSIDNVQVVQVFDTSNLRSEEAEQSIQGDNGADAKYPTTTATGKRRFSVKTRASWKQMPKKSLSLERQQQHDDPQQYFHNRKEKNSSIFGASMESFLCAIDKTNQGREADMTHNCRTVGGNTNPAAIMRTVNQSDGATKLLTKKFLSSYEHQPSLRSSSPSTSTTTLIHTDGDTIMLSESDDLVTTCVAKRGELQHHNCKECLTKDDQRFGSKEASDPDNNTKSAKTVLDRNVLKDYFMFPINKAAGMLKVEHHWHWERKSLLLQE